MTGSPVLHRLPRVRSPRDGCVRMRCTSSPARDQARRGVVECRAGAVAAPHAVVALRSGGRVSGRDVSADAAQHRCGPHHPERSLGGAQKNAICRGTASITIRSFTMASCSSSLSRDFPRASQGRAARRALENMPATGCERPWREGSLSAAYLAPCPRCPHARQRRGGSRTRESRKLRKDGQRARGGRCRPARCRR